MREGGSRRLAGAVACAAVLAPLAVPASGRDDQVVSVETLCTTAKDCRVKLTVGDAPGGEPVVTAFRANRVGPDMKYFPADEYGSCDFRNPGLLYLDSGVVLDHSGVLRPPDAGDPPDAVAAFTATFGVDPSGHVTFFSGVVHVPGEPIARRTYLWGRLGEDLRYFPAEKEGGTRLATTGATQFVDLDVMVDEAGGMRGVEPGDAPAATGTLTSTIALDDVGHVSFFYGFVRDPDSSHVRRFCIWGYPPETLMVDGPDDEATARPPEADRRI